MRINKEEAKRIAELLAETNTILWNAACQVEALVKDEVVSKLIDNEEGNRSAFQKIATAYAQLDKDDEEFVRIEMRGRGFQDFDSFAGDIQSHLDEIEN
ncbi:hypothetical protein ACH6EH_07165 [Paenibacillus sp. JSM ZJ436]|uniref:hypothetical protein n=1 Tax=Paenibacillus sp. JSM ZJ436 TaxID=3376190 RepID=UPI0037A49C8C